MKKQLCIAGILLCASMISANDIVSFPQMNSSTNAVGTNYVTRLTNSAAGGRFISGSVEGIAWTVGGSSSCTITQTFVIATAGGTGSGAARQIFTNTVTTASSGYAPIRMYPKDTSNGAITNAASSVWMPLYQDKIYCIYGNTQTSNTTLDVWLFLK